jgi:hypothetical protein
MVAITTTNTHCRSLRLAVVAMVAPFWRQPLDFDVLVVVRAEAARV